MSPFVTGETVTTKEDPRRLDRNTSILEGLDAMLRGVAWLDWPSQLCYEC